MVDWVEIDDFASDLDDLKLGLGSEFKEIVRRILDEGIEDEDHEVEEERICQLRKIAYGLSACHNCPVSCPVSQDNLNRLSNIETVLEKAKP